MHDSATLSLYGLIRPQTTEFKNDREHVRQVSQVFRLALRLTYEHCKQINSGSCGVAVTHKDCAKIGRSTGLLIMPSSTNAICREASLCRAIT